MIEAPTADAAAPIWNHFSCWKSSSSERWMPRTDVFPPGKLDVHLQLQTERGHCKTVRKRDDWLQ